MKGVIKMDFKKFNREFITMQEMINSYNSKKEIIKSRIKLNEKNINKLELKLKNLKNDLEISITNLNIEIYKNENAFLNTLILDKERG